MRFKLTKLLHLKIWFYLFFLSIISLLIVVSIMLIFKSIFTTYYTMFLYISKGSILLALLCYIILMLQYLHNNPQKDYEKGGDLDSWYFERLHLIGTDWCESFIYLIDLLLEKKCFVILSPSSNAAVYEKKMFLHICNDHKITFICSDYARVDSPETALNVGDSSFTYFPEINALDINALIDSKVDIIFDMKGALWHLRSRRKLDLITKYSEMLNDQGFLIIDNNKENNIICVFSIFLYWAASIFHIKKPVRKEKATTKRMNSKVKKHLLKYFTHYMDISFPTKNNKLLTFSIYKKC